MGGTAEVAGPTIVQRGNNAVAPRNYGRVLGRRLKIPIRLPSLCREAGQPAKIAFRDRSRLAALLGRRRLGYVLCGNRLRDKCLVLGANQDLAGDFRANGAEHQGDGQELPRAIHE